VAAVHELVDSLNGYPSGFPNWLRLDEQVRSEAFRTISALADLYAGADGETRGSVTELLTESAKYAVAEYTVAKGTEGLRTGSASSVTDGLIPVVTAGG
jgi:hypothetical protein